MLTWCCRSPAWCSPPERPPTHCWPSRFRWQSSPCWAPPASRPDPGSGHETGECPGFCGYLSTRCTLRHPGSSWPSLGLHERKQKTIMITWKASLFTQQYDSRWFPVYEIWVRTSSIYIQNFTSIKKTKIQIIENRKSLIMLVWWKCNNLSNICHERHKHSDWKIN